VPEIGAMTNTSLRWFRQRRTTLDLDAATNVIAFPLPTVPSAQIELALSRAS
jgi:hypothetical protein